MCIHVRNIQLFPCMDTRKCQVGNRVESSSSVEKDSIRHQQLFESVSVEIGTGHGSGFSSVNIVSNRNAIFKALSSIVLAEVVHGSVVGVPVGNTALVVMRI